MKKLTLIIFSLFSLLFTSQSFAQEASSDADIAMYYFHYTRRCATCNAVQKVSFDAVKEMYSSKVNVAEYNLDTEDGKAKGESVGVSGQTLIIIKGDTKINITNEAFMNARNNPDKLKQIIKEKLDPLL